MDGVNRDLASFETGKYFRVMPRDLEMYRDELTPSLKINRRVVQEHFRDLIDGMYEGKLLAAGAV